jgi:hypothetical protein
MRLATPWLIAAVVVGVAVIGARADRGDGRVTLLIKNVEHSAPHIILPLKTSSDHVVLALNKVPQDANAMAAADERALFGIAASPAPPREELAGAEVLSEPAAGAEPPRKVSRAHRYRDRCGRICKVKRAASRSRARSDSPKRAPEAVVAAKAPEVAVDPAATTHVDFKAPPSARAGTTALVGDDVSSSQSGGIALDERTSLNVGSLSTIMPARAPDNGVGTGGASLKDERDDPSRSGAAVGVTFKLN